MREVDREIKVAMMLKKAYLACKDLPAAKGVRQRAQELTRGGRPTQSW